MDVLDTAALLGAGLVAGTVNAVAGGGSLVTFPTLVAIGLQPVPANVTNSIAVCPGYLASVFGSRADLTALAAKRGRRALLELLPTALCGTAVGCALLLATPARAFEIVVPFLVLGATALFAFGDRLRRPAIAAEETTSRRGRLAMHAVVGGGAVYGGYFGAGLGVILVALFSVILPESLARVTALKNSVSAVVGLGTVVAFALYGPVHWVAVAVLAPTTLIGGYLGARLVRVLPARTLRMVVVVVGTGVAVVLFLRAF